MFLNHHFESYECSKRLKRKEHEILACLCWEFAEQVEDCEADYQQEVEAVDAVKLMNRPMA